MVAEGEEVKPGSDTFLQELAPNKTDPRWNKIYNIPRSKLDSSESYLAREPGT